MKDVVYGKSEPKVFYTSEVESPPGVVSEELAAVASSPIALIGRLRAGFDASWIIWLAYRLDISQEMLAPLLGTSPVSLSRWMKASKRLDQHVSEAAFGINETLALADTVFGSHRAALRWLKTANAGLDSIRPLDLLDSETGRGLVRRQLLGIEHSAGF